MSTSQEPDSTSNGWNTTELTPLLFHENGDQLDAPTKEDVTTQAMFWHEFYTISRYALPIIGSQTLELSMIFVPVISIGHLSTTTLAAVSLGSMTANVTGLSIFQGLSSGLDTLLPSAYTSGQPQLVGLWTQRMAVIQVFALAPILLIWLKAEPILLALKQDPEVAHLAAVYLRWLSFGLPAFAFNRISRRYFQSQGYFSVQTSIVCFAAPLNVLLNYLLVWGPKPIRLGFIGAPIATVLASYFISVASWIYGAYIIPRTAWHPLSSRMFTKLGLLTRLGLSGIAQLCSEWWAWEFVALAASFLGPAHLASQSILITTSAFFFQVPYSIANATSIRIGNLLGEQNAKRAHVAANTSLVVSLTASVLTSTTLLLCRHSWPKLFNTDPVVVNLVASVMPLIALFQVVDGNSAVTAGILRARGKQFVGAVLNISAYYVIGLPIGVWLAFRWNMGLHGLWIGLTLSLIYCSLIGTALCFGTDWDKEVQKVLERLAEEERLKNKADMEALEG